MLQKIGIRLDLVTLKMDSFECINALVPWTRLVLVFQISKEI